MGNRRSQSVRLITYKAWWMPSLPFVGNAIRYPPCVFPLLLLFGQGNIYLIHSFTYRMQFLNYLSTALYLQLKIPPVFKPKSIFKKRCSFLHSFLPPCFLYQSSFLHFLFLQLFVRYQYSAQARVRFGVSLGLFVDSLNTFSVPGHSSTIQIRYPGPDMQLLLKYFFSFFFQFYVCL